MTETIEHLLHQRYIYTVTTIRTKDNDRSVRCVGWFSDEIAACDIVAENYGDINESEYYRYTVVEKIGQGLYCTPEEEFWFEWNVGTEKHDPIDKPKEFENVINFGIG